MGVAFSAYHKHRVGSFFIGSLSMTFLHMRELSIVAAAVIALSGTAMADDHLFQAEQPGHGLFDNTQSQGIANADEAPGQGSPFTGGEQSIPSTNQEHAQHDQQVHQPDQAGPKK
jgi:hypothetical protein